MRSRTEPGAATRMSFRAEELLTVPGTFGEPTRVVATLPGVARTPFGLGFFVVRGASFENTGFFVDGYPVLLLYHLGAGPAILSSRLVGQMDFYPGGYPVQFGRFSAGVISLETRPPPTERPRMEVEIDLLRASALGVVPFADGRGTLAVAVRRSYYDALLPLLQPGVSVSFGDAQVRADYRFSEAVRASLFWFGSMDTFDRTQAIGSGLSAATARDALSYNFWRGIGRVEVRSPSGASGYVSAMVGWDDIGLVQSNPGRPDTGVRANGATMGLRAQVRAPAGPVLTASGGVDILAYSYAVSLQAALASGIGAVPMPQSNPTIAGIRGNVTQFGIAPWLEAVLRSGPMEFTAGARAEALGYQGNQFLVGDPRAVLRVRAHPRLTVVGASGWFHQAPTFFSLLDGAGNPNLLPQRAWQSSVGVELDLPLNLELRLTGFFNSMWQLQRATYDFVPSSGSSGGAMRALLVSDGQGRSYGLEVLLRRRLERGLYGWLSYTLSRSERFLGEGRVVPFTFDQTHVLNIALSYEPLPALRFGARFQLATGSPTSLVRGSIYDADADGYRPVYTSEADRLPTYHQLDVRADYRFRLGPLQMSTYLDVLNVYYAQNAEGWVYQYDYADRRTRPGLPILPTVGIRGEL